MGELILEGTIKERQNKNIFLFLCFVTYKFALEYGFWFILKPLYLTSNVYNFDFNFAKYIIGMFWCLILFLFIQHNERRPSTFFLQLQYAIAIIPITVIYAFSDENSLYYTAVCIGFAVAEIIILFMHSIKMPELRWGSMFVIISFLAITIIVYGDMVLENGMFSLKALNIFNIYDIRADFKLNKYVGYMFAWQYIVINPFFIVRAMKQKNIFVVGFFVLLQLIAYFYAAQKTILFIIPLILVIYWFSTSKYFNSFIFFGLTILISGTALTYKVVGLSTELFGLFARRVMLVPANLKFLYYDFFTNNEKIGFAGTIVGKVLKKEYPYDDTLGFMISKTYFNNPDMSSNTGFLAEGYYRFGLFGIVIILIIFGLLMLLIDSFAEKNDYSIAVSICFFSIFLLNDGALIDPLTFGNLTVLVFLFIFYSYKYDNFGFIKRRLKKND